MNLQNFRDWLENQWVNNQEMEDENIWSENIRKSIINWAD